VGGGGGERDAEKERGGRGGTLADAEAPSARFPVPGSHLGQIGQKHALQFVDVELLTIPMQAKAKQTWLIL